MESYLFEVAHLVFRFFHVIAGVAWIGASFYFVWLDNSLETPPDWKKDKGIKGDLWAIHGGGFYEVAKYQNGPEQMPQNLHWFKWEAYTTWITGMLLFGLLYYIGAQAYLLDPAKAQLSQASAIAISLASVALGYVVYRLLCKSPLVDKGIVFALVLLSLFGLWIVGIDQLFSDRAVYIHAGVLVGTCMAGNVFHVIMPSQSYMVNEVAAGRIPDATPGMRAKQVSVHNNYATLPIIFIMLSNHFPYTFSHEYGVAILLALFVIGMWIRHFFNLKHRGQYRPQVLVSGLLAFVVLMIAIAPWSAMQVNEDAAKVSDEQVWAVIDKHCTECHSQNPRSTMFQVAPLGFVLDSLDDVKQQHGLVFNRAIVTKDMPLANMTQMTPEERDLLATWLQQNKAQD